MEGKNVMILGKDKMYSMDCKETKVNNNVLVVGASGCGKTRGIVSPNILLATGSYIISDPKGNLYNKYKDYLESKGYVVKKLDFTDPLNSSHYNYLNYIRTPMDIVKAAHMICAKEMSLKEPFWDQAATMLLTAFISYCIEFLAPEEQNFRSVEKLIQAGYCDENDLHSDLSVLMNMAEKRFPDSFAVNQYKNVRVSANRTFASILITLSTKLSSFTSEEIRYMMSCDDLDLTSFGTRKSALFVIVSDTDRSMDILADLFFTQAISELIRFADTQCENCELPIPVRFILDDFATNCVIDDFPRMISSIRSRGISTTLMIQSESQLEKTYGPERDTVIGNCDTYVYLGGSDLETSKNIAEKLDVPLKKVLNLPIGQNIIFRRGHAPEMGENVNLEDFEKQYRYKRLLQKTSTKFIDNRPLQERLRGEEKKTENTDISIDDLVIREALKVFDNVTLSECVKKEVS